MVISFYSTTNKQMKPLFVMLGAFIISLIATKLFMSRFEYSTFFVMDRYEYNVTSIYSHWAFCLGNDFDGCPVLYHLKQLV